MTPVLVTPDIGPFSLPDSSKPGSAPAHKDPNVQVWALFGTDKLASEILYLETRQVMKDLLKTLVFRADWVTFEPLWDRYRGFWCKRMVPDLLAYVFCSCFLDGGKASLARSAGWAYEQIYNVASTVGQGSVSRELLEKQWVAMDLPCPKTVANYSLWINQWVLHVRRTAHHSAPNKCGARRVSFMEDMGQNLPTWQSWRRCTVSSPGMLHTHRWVTSSPGAISASGNKNAMRRRSRRLQRKCACE